MQIYTNAGSHPRFLKGGDLMNITIWDLMCTIQDARPIFIVSVNSHFVDVYTFGEMALNDTMQNLIIRKMRIRSVNGKPTYILDCETGVNND